MKSYAEEGYSIMRLAGPKGRTCHAEKTWHVLLAAALLSCFLGVNDLHAASNANAQEGTTAASGGNKDSEISNAQSISQGGEPVSAVAGPRSSNSYKYDFDAPPKTRNRLTRSLYYGGALQLETDYERNYNLDDDDDADVWILEPRFRLGFTYQPRQDLWAYIDFNLKSKSTFIDRQDEEDTKTSLTIKRAYVMFDKILEDLSVKVGRQRFDDKREWFYDEELDAVRLYYRNWGGKFEASVSREDFVDGDLLNNTNNDEINNYFLKGRFKLPKKTRLELYALFRDDRDKDNGSPLFLGTQIRGKYARKSSYWLSGAYVLGKDEYDRREGKRDDLRAYGFDLGTTFVFDTILSPSLTLAFAYGSGDDDEDGDTNKNFRQTDLQDNSARFNGVTSFKYYGELMDPELSNMSIWYGGVGIRPTRKSSIDLVYHDYRQVEASDDIRDSDLDTDPNGMDKDLGRELDLVIGYQEIKNLKTELVVAYFWPGDAFSDDADDALFAGLQMRYNF